MSASSNQFVRWVDSLLPVDFVRQSDETSLVRARLIMAVFLFSGIVVAIAAFVMLCISLLLIRNLYIGAVFSVSVAAGMGAGAWYLHRNGHLAVAANWFAGLMFVSIGGAFISTGGPGSPVAYLLLAVPVSIFLVAGKKSGLVWAAATIFLFLCTSIASQNGIHFIQIMKEENKFVVSASMWVLTCIIILGCLSLYDTMVESFMAVIREERERFRTDALYDPLTGVMNRDSFHKLFNEVLENACANTGRLALLRFNVENLRAINAQLDYELGDEFLKKVAAALQATAKNNVVFARFVSGEFAALIPEIKDRGEVIDLASRIRAVLSNRFDVGDGIELYVQTHVGGVLAPDFSAEGRQLLRGANDAMNECMDRDELFVIR